MSKYHKYFPLLLQKNADIKHFGEWGVTQETYEAQAHIQFRIDNFSSHKTKGKHILATCDVYPRLDLLGQFDKLPRLIRCGH